jgi:hypothetical protein
VQPGVNQRPTHPEDIGLLYRHGQQRGVFAAYRG